MQISLKCRTKIPNLSLNSLGVDSPISRILDLGARVVDENSSRALSNVARAGCHRCSKVQEECEPETRIRREEHLADPSIATFISNLIEGAVLEMKHHQLGEND
jgi:hypothetical protein